MTTSGPELVFDEELNAYRIKVAPVPTQRKPETGERLPEVPAKLDPGICYLCGREPASVYFSAAIPQCVVCHERFRRRE